MKHSRQVQEVLNGDTFHISASISHDGALHRKIRLIGFDAPEKYKPGFKEAKELLEELILKTKVDIEPAAVSHGFLLAKVYKDRKDVGDLMKKYSK